MSRCAVKAIGLLKSYRTGGKSVSALRGTDLRVNEGEVFALLGPNGAGKTTLVKILATILRPDSGMLSVLGIDVLSKHAGRARRLVGYAGQDAERSGYARLSVEENLAYFARTFRGASQTEAKEMTDTVVSGLGIAQLRKKDFGVLSGGERQAVVVARAFLHSPRLCFLDEPTKSLDPVGARRVRDFIRAYVRSRSATVIVTTHNMQEVTVLCDRVGFMHDGLMRFVGTVDEFKAKAPETVVMTLSEAIDKELSARLHAVKAVRYVDVQESTTQIVVQDQSGLVEAWAILADAGLASRVRIREPNVEDAYTQLLMADAHG